MADAPKPEKEQTEKTPDMEAAWQEYLDSTDKVKALLKYPFLINKINNRN